MYGEHTNVSKRDTWCVDSGATSHMCCDREMFTSFTEKSARVMLAAETFIESHGIGSVVLKRENSKITLQDVLFVPSLLMNFLSVSKGAQYGNSTIFTKDRAIIKTKTRSSAPGRACKQFICI